MLARFAQLATLTSALGFAAAPAAQASTHFSVNIGVGVPAPVVVGAPPPVVVAAPPVPVGAPPPYEGYVWQPGYYVGYRWVPGYWVRPYGAGRWTRERWERERWERERWERERWERERNHERWERDHGDWDGDGYRVYDRRDWRR